MRNNVATYIHYSAWDAATNSPKTGDVANHTLKLVIDGVLSSPDNSPEEIAAGEYRLLLTAAESNGKKFITVAGVSSTGDVYIIPAMLATDLLISGASFTGCYVAWDVANNVPKTGDAANHTIIIAQDNTSAGASNSPSEVDAVNAPGLYKVLATAAEATGKAVSIVGTSSTGNIIIMPTEIAPFTVDYPAASNVRLGIDYAETTLTGTAAIPTAVQVLDGVAVDDSVGNVSLPAVDEVEVDVEYGPNDSLTGALEKITLPLEVIDIATDVEVSSLTIVRGDKKVLLYQIQEDGEAVDITGFTFKLGIKETAQSEAYKIGPIDGVIVDAENGKLSFTLLSTVTDQVSFDGRIAIAMYDDSGNKSTVSPPGGAPFYLQEDILDVI